MQELQHLALPRVRLQTATTRKATPMTDDIERSDEKVRAWDRRTLCRELAVGEVRRTQLARKYGVTPQAITQFAKRHAREIDDIRADLDNEFAGLWVASKVARIAAYQADLERSLDGEYADHYEQIRTRQAGLRAVAEELGQLPPRATVALVPVQHILEGVDLDALT